MRLPRHLHYHHHHHHQQQQQQQQQQQNLQKWINAGMKSTSSDNNTIKQFQHNREHILQDKLRACYCHQQNSAVQLQALPADIRQDKDSIYFVKGCLT